jgi:FeS assembly SUF system protein
MENQALNDTIIEFLKTVFDPEMPVNIYDLGLIYEVKIDDSKNVKIIMTLTNPNCPMAEDMPIIVKNTVKEINGVNDVEVEVVFEPEWNPDLMTDAAKLELGML